MVTNYTYSKGLLSKVDRQGEITNYDYDSNNRVSGIRMDGKHSQQFAYDRLDRVIKVVENIKNEKTYTTETVYDAFGRIKKEIYPDGYAVNNSYDSYGNLISVTDSYDNKIWQGLSANARGQLIKSKQGNTEKTQLYDSRGLPSSITAAGIIIMAYTFNDKGNLTSRSDLLTGHKEDFTYDTMNRLTAWDVSKSNVSQVNNSINYNPTTGTITTKSDVGFTFNYGEENGKPHALTSISGKPDRIPHSAQTITYTDFKKVKSISLGNKSLVLDYGVDEQRRKGVFKEGNVTFTRYYSGNYEEEISSSGKIKKIHYISGGDGLTGIYINDDGNSNFYSAYCDYQGSLLALTDINGVVKEKYAYDPWGNRRNPALWKDADTRTKFIIDRGYTLHEHLDALGLINMNGRVYDPLLGMFLSPDPYVQAPGNWLNYNRYGYCLNNPLIYTDPDGELWWLIPIAVGAVINWATNGADFTWEGLGYFGVGALAGASTLISITGVGAAIVPAITGGITGAGNNLVSQGFAYGSGNTWSGYINWGEVGISGISGAITGFLGGKLSDKFSPYVNKYVSKIFDGPMLQDMVTNSVVSGATGFTVGAGWTAFSGGSFEESMQAGWNSAKVGFAVGGATGSFSGWQRAKEARVSPWTGEPIQRHHSDPKFMGGDPKQRLTPMSTSRHKELHKNMYDYLRQHTDDNGNHMRPQSNNSGARIRNNFIRSQRFDALKGFYDNYPIKYWDARRGFYRNNHIMRQWRPW